MTLRAAIYARISDDRRGEALGVGRQREDCVSLAERRGHSVVRVYTDNSVSAYSGRVRPGYRELLAAIAAGGVDVVLAWDPDRLHRSPAELEDFIVLMERHGVAVETVQAGTWDLATPSGRLVARQLGSVARYESEHKAERVRRALEQNAAGGRPHGRHAYGWRRVYDTESGRGRDVIEPGEAAVIRDVAARIIRGESMNAVTVALNEAGTPSPTGKPWAKGMVRAVMLRERNAGLRVHHGEVVGEGEWEPVLPLATFEQVRAILRDPQRRTSTSSAAVHLLSGIARCGKCGAPMRAGQNGTTPSYRCSAKSCVSRARSDVDGLVTRVVLGRLAQPDAAALLTPGRSDEHKLAAAEAAALRGRLDDAADNYADGKIDGRQLERITARLRPQIEAAELRARMVDDTPLLAGLAGNERAAAVWEGRTLSQKRGVIDMLVSVTVLGAKPGARVFDPEAVRVEWKL